MKRGGGKHAGARKFYINGRFLGQPISGVQRYARELVAALDRQIGRSPDDAEAWHIVVRDGGIECPKFANITRVNVPSWLNGHVWEQVRLAAATRDGLLINLANTGSLWRRNQLSVIHDMAVFRHPEFFSGVYGAWHRFLSRRIARVGRVGTVSDFSRAEIAEIIGLSPDSISVLRNGCDHMQSAEEDPAAVDRLGLARVCYFIALGNQTRNKNLGTALAAIAQVPEAHLVIIGGARPHVFEGGQQRGNQDRVHYLGRLDDAEVGGLLRRTTGLVFPSIYEGFGIPPIEALAKGCPVLSSDIPPVRQSCGDAALYFPPFDAETLAGLMRRVMNESAAEKSARRERGFAVASALSWDRSARTLIDLCRTFPGETR